MVALALPGNEWACSEPHKDAVEQALARQIQRFASLPETAVSSAAKIPTATRCEVLRRDSAFPCVAQFLEAHHNDTLTSLSHDAGEFSKHSEPCLKGISSAPNAFHQSTRNNRGFWMP